MRVFRAYAAANPKLRERAYPSGLSPVGMGMDADEILTMYPHLTAAQVHDALSYYFDYKAEVDAVRAQNTEEYWQARQSQQ